MFGSRISAEFFLFKQFSKGNFMTKLVFDNAGFLRTQLVEALTCPLNRHGTRVEYNCDDWGLFQNPQWLIFHFIENGGAAEFAKRRDNFFIEIEVSDQERLEETRTGASTEIRLETPPGIEYEL
jgi:hypothetical protein